MFAPHGVLIVFSIFDNVIIWGEGVSGDGGGWGIKAGAALIRFLPPSLPE